MPISKIVVLYDDSGQALRGCTKACGLSLLADVGGALVLFDAGGDPKILWGNAKAAGVDVESIDAVVLSHAHGDHTGGLARAPEALKERAVYIPFGQHRGLRDWLKSLGFRRVEVVSKATKIADGAYVIPFPESAISEQALLAGLGEDYVMLVGCSHPGIHYMVSKAVRMGFRVAGVVGGLHLRDAPEQRVGAVFIELARLGVRRVIPLHCSGEFAREYARALMGFDGAQGALCGEIGAGYFAGPRPRGGRSWPI